MATINKITGSVLLSPESQSLLGLRIELTQASAPAGTWIGSSLIDTRGRFEILLTDPLETGINMTAEIYKGKQMLHSETVVLGTGPLSINVAEQAYDDIVIDDSRFDDSINYALITGQVTLGDEEIAAIPSLRDNVRVTARKVLFRNNEELVSTFIDDFGRYEIKVPYRLLYPAFVSSPPTLQSAIPHILVDVSINGTITTSSAYLPFSDTRMQVDLHISDEDVFPAFLTEYDYLATRMEALTNVARANFYTISVSGPNSEIDALVTSSGLDAGNVRDMIAASQLVHDTGIDGTHAYALVCSHEGSLEVLSGLAAATIATTIDTARANHVIPVAGTIDATVNALTNTRTMLVGADDNEDGDSLEQMLATILPDGEKVQRFLAMNLEKTDLPVAEFWQQVQAEFGVATTQRLQKGLQLLAVTGLQPEMTEALIDASGSSVAEHLAAMDYNDWRALIGSVCEANQKLCVPKSVRDGVTGGDQKVMDVYADKLYGLSTDLFATTVLKNRTVEDENFAACFEDAESVFTFLSGSAQYDLRTTNAWQYDFGGNERLKNDLLPLQNLTRLTGGQPDAVVKMMIDGIRSSSHIAAMQQADFVTAYAPYLRSTDLAQQIHTKALHTDMLIKQSYTQLMPGNYVEKVTKDFDRQIWVDQPASPPGNPTTPDLETLFGSLDFCACSDCSSMYSPAAYFTDVLNFIKTRLGSAVAYTELNRRRSDLIHIDLTCKNSNTPLPYIDLVNELLELMILRDIKARDPGEGSLFIPLSFQTSGTAKELEAYPEHTYKDTDGTYKTYKEYTKVYDNRLKKAIYPNTLPFDLALEESRVYFKHLGYSRYELMRRYRPEDYLTTTDATVLSDYNIMAEWLQLSRNAANIITDPTPANTADIARFYGYPDVPPAAWYNDLCSDLEGLLHRCSITYKELLQLLVTDFLNKETGIPAKRPFAIVAKPGKPADTCKVDELMLAYRPDASPPVEGVAEKIALFDRLHRYIRLYRATGWSIYQLDVVLSSFNATAINVPVFLGVAKAHRLCDRFAATPEKMSVLWGRISTRRYINFDSETQDLMPSVYDSFFRNKAIVNPPDPNFDDPAGITGTIGENMGTILAAFGIAGSDVSYAASTSSPTTLDSLSNLYKYTLLMKGVGYDSFKSLFEAIYLLPNSSSPVGTPLAQVPQWDALIVTLDRIKSTAFSQRELTYLLRHVDFDQNLRPSDETIQQFFEGLRLELRNQQDTTNPNNYDLLQKIAMQRFAAYFGIGNKLAGYLLEAVFEIGNTPDAALNILTAAEFIDSTDSITTGNGTPNLNFSELYALYYRVDKVAVVVNRLNISADEALMMDIHRDKLDVLPLAEYPYSPTGGGALIHRFLQYNDWIRVRDTLRLKKDQFIELMLASVGLGLEGQTVGKNEWFGVVQRFTQWPLADLEVLLGQAAAPNPAGILKAVYDAANPAQNSYRRGALLLQVNDIMAASYRTGLQTGNTYEALKPSIQVAQSQMIRKTAKAKYSDEAWQKIAKPLQDQLREQQRKALVAYIIAKPDIVAGNNMKWKNENDLFAYLFIDVEMQPCMKTSRIKQGISSLQLFLDRIILNIERVNGSTQLITMTPDMVEQWQTWRKWYRVWEANRKVFLYPENWIEPELRDNKTALFKDLETQLLQDEVTPERVENAYRFYLENLDEVARLEPVSAYHEVAPGRDIVHVFSRTDVYPQRYYYRRLQDNEWSPWERINVDIKSDHVAPVMWNGRLYLFWLTFQKQKLSDTEISNAKKAARFTPQKEWIDAVLLRGDGLSNNSDQAKMQDEQSSPYSKWDITLNWSLYHDNKWQKSDLSKDVMNIDMSKVLINNQAQASYGNATYAAQVLQILTKRGEVKIDDFFRNRLYLFTPFEGANEADGITFNLLFPAGLDENGIGMHTFLWKGDCSRDPFVLRDNDRGHQVIAPLGTRFNKMKFEEDPTQDGKLKKDSYTSKIDGYYSYSANTYISNFGRTIRTTASQVILNRTPYDRFRVTAKAANRGTHDMNPLEDKFFFEDERHTFYVQKVQGPVYSVRVDSVRVATRTSLSASIGYVVEKYNPGPAQYLAQQPTGTLYNGPISSTVPTDTYRFHTFYHAQLPKFVAALNKGGIPALLTLPNQAQTDTMAFSSTYQPTALVNSNYPSDNVQFDFSAPYSIYNWELFFHAPMLIAQGLSNNQKFEEAMKWYHYIFNPTSNTNINGATIATNQRFWKFYPFYTASATPAQTLSQLIMDIHNNVSAAVDQVRKWEKNPFNPHIIARMRILAYMKNVLMKYLDNLIAWGDQLFKRDTIESINEATQLYILAANLLGERPREVPARVQKKMRTFAELLQNGPLDALSNALVAIESFYAPNAGPVGSKVDPKTGREIPGLMTLYFCLPKNDKLMGYWDAIADRLFKIRNCMNIEGTKRQLPLYEPPIDPALLVRATAMGIDINTVLDQINEVNTPLYRFSYVVQKANELVNDVRGLGSALLSAIEKKDAEALSLLRSGQEIEMLERVKLIKELQLNDAETALEVLQRTRENVQIRHTYYTTRPFKNSNEEAHLNRLNSAMGFQIAQGILETTAGILSIMPTVHAQFVASGVSFGGLQLANVMRAASTGIGIKVGIDNMKGTMAVTTGGYERRRDDWVFQANTAAKELQQLDEQILGAQIRIDIARKELANHELQIDNARDVDAYMRSKFSNVELYNWTIAQVSATYFQSYQLAYDMAKRAEWCYKYELPKTQMPATGFIKFGYWDSLRKGLLSGERLQFDLRKMEAAYMEENKREYELTKNVSLAIFSPQDLLELKRTGSCTVSIPEELFDLDHPGHYMRRIKSVSLSIPCIAGPYTTISCNLRQMKSKYRKETTGAYPEVIVPINGDGRFVYYDTPGDAIATSTAQNDSGVFELNFRDERYLPFEGTGAISEWKLILPEEHRQFDYESINDVIFHIKYTAKDGGEPLKTGAAGNLTNVLNAVGNSVLFRYFSLRHEFSNEWFRYQKARRNGEPGAQFKVVLRPDDFPYFCKGRKIQITGWSLQLNPKENNLGLMANAPASGIDEVLLEGREGQTIALTLPQYITVGEGGATVAMDWTFTCDHTMEDLEDFYLVAHYTLTDQSEGPFNPCLRTVSLEDFTGNSVAGYPAGVFDRHGKYLGVAESKAQYADLWNNAPGNLGFAKILETASDNVFEMIGDPEETIESLRAMHAFQFDFQGHPSIDAISAPENGYIDFGDGTVIKVQYNAVLPVNTFQYRVNAPNVPLHFYIGNTNGYDRTYQIGNYSISYKHIYNSNGPWKVSVLFNLDSDYILDTDNMDSDPLTTFATNLRGFLPPKTRALEFTSTQTATFNTLANIRNLQDVIPNLWRFALRSGANNTIPVNVNFGTWDFPEVQCLDFGTFHFNSPWLYTPIAIRDLIGTANLPAKYPKLHTIGFMGNKYTSDLNLAIPNIRYGIFGAFSGFTPSNPLPAGAVDQIMIQLDSVKNDTGGTLSFASAPPATTAGQAAMQSLQNKGMTILFN